MHPDGERHSGLRGEKSDVASVDESQVAQAHHSTSRDLFQSFARLSISVVSNGQKVFALPAKEFSNRQMLPLECRVLVMSQSFWLGKQAKSTVLARHSLKILPGGHEYENEQKVGALDKWFLFANKKNSHSAG